MPASAKRCAAKLLTVLARNDGGRSDTAALVNEGTFGGNAPDNIFGGQKRPPEWWVVGHGQN